MRFGGVAIYLNYYILISLMCLYWFFALVLSWIAGAVFLMVVVVEKSPLDSDFYYIFSGIIIIVILWRLSTFHVGDFLRIARKRRVSLIEKGLLWRTFSSIMWSVEKGSFGNSIVASNISGATLYIFFVNILYGDKYASLKPDNAYETDKVILATGLSSDLYIREKLTIKGSERDIPKTGVTVIDNAIDEALAYETDFVGELIVDNKSLSLIVQGSPYLGKRFERRIQKAFDLFDQISKGLDSKYSRYRISAENIQWNKETKTFDIRL